MTEVKLPNGNRIESYRLGGPGDFSAPDVAWNRIAFAAAHVVADPFAEVDPWLEPAIDWDATMAYRHHLWRHGFAIAEAMDTAQRGMGLSWEHALDLIRRSVKEAATVEGAKVYSGVGTDHVAPSPDMTPGAIRDAYLEQLEAVEGVGGRVILMASRALAAGKRPGEDYIRVYDRILGQVKEPVILHWLGEMFDPALKGYWGSDDHMAAMDVCLDIIARNAAKVDGVKISLLSKEKEIEMRRRLPKGVRMYTGDDFNYAELIAGDEQGYSEALLGIFDGIAPAASASLARLAKNDLQ
ncbi:MAG: DUF993 family protein, partial [Geminicoccaceae bacterium]|nr:DUF993 family protein [Geminicoccaceae bacterium]